MDSIFVFSAEDQLATMDDDLCLILAFLEEMFLKAGAMKFEIMYDMGLDNVKNYCATGETDEIDGGSEGCTESKCYLSSPSFLIELKLVLLMRTCHRSLDGFSETLSQGFDLVVTLGC